MSCNLRQPSIKSGLGCIANRKKCDIIFLSFSFLLKIIKQIYIMIKAVKAAVLQPCCGSLAFTKTLTSKFNKRSVFE